jgi:hypothetical protein
MIAEIEHCESCESAVERHRASWFEIRDRMHYLCEACASDPAASARGQIRGADMRRAAIFGAVAGSLGATLWYFVVVATGLEVGIVAAVLGWVTSAGVLFGAGPWRGRRLQLLAVALTLASLVLAQYLITWHFIQRYAVEKLGERIALPPTTVFEVMSDAIRSDVAILAFWAIALISAYELPSRVKIVRPASLEAAPAVTS